MDPVWDVDYPAADGRFLGVRDLAGTKLGPERVAELQRRSPESAKVRRMPTTEAIYNYAFAFNWDKNAASRYVASALKRLGYDPESWLRPPLLEDPKLALVSALLTLAAALLAMGTAIAFVLPSLNERLLRSWPRQWRGAEPPPV